MSEIKENKANNNNKTLAISNAGDNAKQHKLSFISDSSKNVAVNLENDLVSIYIYT